MKLAKFLMTPFYTEHIRWLLLLIVHNKSSAFIVNFERVLYPTKRSFSILLHIYRKAPVLESPINKISGCLPANVLKRDSDRGVFQWILQSFLRKRFYRKPLGDCFCNSHSHL